MQKAKIIILFFIFAVAVLMPAVSHAALVPCGRSGEPMCTLCDLIIGFHGIIGYGFTIMTVVGIVMITIAGIVYIISAGNTEMMNTAKGLLKNALIGFAIILGAWLIVNTTILLIGARGDLGIGIKSWNEFTCVKK